MTDTDKAIIARMRERVRAMTGIEKALWLAGDAVLARGDTHSDRTELARQLGISNQAVFCFVQRGYLPAERATRVHEIYGVPYAELVKP